MQSERVLTPPAPVPVEQTSSAKITREDLVPFVVEGVATALADDRELPVSAESRQNVSSAKADLHFGRSTTVVLEKPIPVEPRIAESTLHWPEKVDVLGVEVSVTTYDELIRLFIVAARRRESITATFMAVHAVVTAALDPSYRYRINAFDVVGPDGQPVRWALNLLHKVGLKERVCGPFMMERLCARAAEEGVGIYLYGSSPKTLTALQTNLEDRFPAIRIVGIESPPFRALTDDENSDACQRINSSGAGLVFIGLGCPKQDIFAHRNRNRIQAVQLCVGAAFDFHAGNKKMAPGWMQKYGLEWTYRLLQEPGRLWKRYLVTNTWFVLLMSRRMLTGK